MDTVVIRNCEAKNLPLVLKIVADSVNLKNIVIHNNIIFYGIDPGEKENSGLLRFAANPSTTAFLLNISFIDNEVSGKGGNTCILALEEVNIVIKNSSFIKNKASLYSSSINFQGKILLLAYVLLVANTMVAETNIFNSETYGLNFLGEKLEIRNTSASLNEASDGSVLRSSRYSSYLNRHILIANSSFLNNTSKNSAFQFLETNNLEVTVENSVFKYNWALSIGGTFRLYYEGSDIFSFNFLDCIFLGNRALKGAVAHLANLIGNIIFEKCMFNNNQAVMSGGVFSITTEAGVKINTNECLIQNNVAGKNGGFFEMIVGEFCDRKSLFSNNSAKKGSLMIGGSYSTISLSDSFLEKNRASFTAAILIGGSAETAFTNIFVFSCESREYSAFLAVHGNAKLTAESSTFYGNRGGIGTILFTANSNKMVRLNGCTFENNEGKTNSFYVKYGALLVENSSFIENKGKLFQAIYAVLNIQKSNFERGFCRLGSLGCLFSFSQSSVISLFLSKILNYTSTAVDGLCYGVNSKITIFETRIINPNCSSINSLKAESCDIIINRTEIVDYFETCFKLSESKLFIENSLFQAAISSTTSNAINNINTDIQIYYSKLTNNRLSAIQAVSNSEKTIDIVGCFFTQNINNGTGEGGALRLTDINVNIENTQFTGNLAQKNGGAIFFYCRAVNPKACVWTIKKSKFSQNVVNYGGGGAIYWEGRVPLLKDDNEFHENSAQYGPDKASNPIRLRISGNEDYLSLVNKTFSSLISGHPFKTFLLLEHIDFYEQIINTTDQLISRISIIKSSGSNSEKKKYMNFSSDLISILGSVSVFSLNGLVNFTSLTAIALPTSNVQFEIQTDAILRFEKEIIALSIANSKPEAFGSSMETTTTGYSFLMPGLFSSCEIGQIYNPVRNLCESCSIGHYSLNITDSACYSCPENAQCPGGSVIILNEGFWRVSINSTDIYACNNKYACVGGYDKLCQVGFEGTLCNLCINEDGDRADIYYMDIDKKCKSCTSNEKNKSVGVVFVVVLVITIYIVIIIRSKIARATKLGSVLLKILTDYLQIAGLITSIEVDLPIDLSSVFILQDSVGSTDSLMVPLDCALKGIFDDSLNVFFKKLIFSAIMFCSLPFLIITFWLCYRKIKSLKPGVLRSRILISIVIVFFTVQPSFVKQISGGLICRTINSVSYLDKYLDEVCWNALHLKIIALIIVPMLSCLIAIVPIFFLRIIIRAHKEQKQLAEFSFLTVGYKYDYYYWDFVIMIKKFTLILATIFTENKNLKASLLIMISFLYIFIQLNVEPYSANILNKAALYSRLGTYSLVFNLLVNLLSTNATAIYTVFIVLPLINLNFFIRWSIYYFGMKPQIVRLLAKFFPKKFTQYYDPYDGVLKPIALWMAETKSPTSKTFAGFFSPRNGKNRVPTSFPKIAIKTPKKEIRGKLEKTEIVSKGETGNQNIQNINLDGTKLVDY